MIIRKNFSSMCIVALAFSIISCGVKNDDSKEYDLREIRWGMSKAEVQDSEGKPFEEEEEWYGRYKSNITLFGFDATSLSYYFNTSGELHSVVGLLFFKQINSSGYISDFNEIESVITEVYGRPIEDIEKGVYEYQSDAIENLFSFCGETDYFSCWKTQRSEIALAMMQEGPTWVTLIMFESLIISHDR